MLHRDRRCELGSGGSRPPARFVSRFVMENRVEDQVFHTISDFVSMKRYAAVKVRGSAP